jgi:hypothetical protein
MEGYALFDVAYGEGRETSRSLFGKHVFRGIVAKIK